MSSKQTIAVVLSEDLCRQLRETATAEDTSVSAVVRRALLRFFAAQSVTQTNVLRDAS